MNSTEIRKNKNGLSELVIVREFNAPRELVFNAWKDERIMAKWKGPKSFITPHCSIDFRVGGKHLYCLHAPDGKDYWGTGVYLEIIEPEKIVYKDDFADEKGNIVPASAYGFPDEWQEERIVTVTFEKLGNRTKMTLVHTGLPEGDMIGGAGIGWNESFDKLALSLDKS
jgi:uncharacterized protein YndB with AHSA1/START domain